MAMERRSMENSTKLKNTLSIDIPLSAGWVRCGPSYCKDQRGEISTLCGSNFHFPVPSCPSCGFQSARSRIMPSLVNFSKLVYDDWMAFLSGRNSLACLCTANVLIQTVCCTK